MKRKKVKLTDPLESCIVKTPQGEFRLSWDDTLDGLLVTSLMGPIEIRPCAANVILLRDGIFFPEKKHEKTKPKKVKKPNRDEKHPSIVKLAKTIIEGESLF